MRSLLQRCIITLSCIGEAEKSVLTIASFFALIRKPFAEVFARCNEGPVGTYVVSISNAATVLRFTMKSVGPHAFKRNEYRLLV